MMSIRKSLLLCNKQSRLFCHTTLAEKLNVNKIDQYIFGVAVVGGIVGGGCGGVSGYNSSRDLEKKGIYVFGPLSYYHICVIDTTIGSIAGMATGFVLVYLSPLVLSIAAIVAGARYLRPIESKTLEENHCVHRYTLHPRKN
jgi:hypothetical protein